MPAPILRGISSSAVPCETLTRCVSEEAPGVSEEELLPLHLGIKSSHTDWGDLDTGMEEATELQRRVLVGQDLWQNNTRLSYLALLIRWIESSLQVILSQEKQKHP